VTSTVVWLFKIGVCKKINILYLMGKSTVIMLKILGANLRNSIVRDFNIPGCDKSEGRKFRLIFIIFVMKFGNDCVPVWHAIGCVHTTVVPKVMSNNFL